MTTPTVGSPDWLKTTPAIGTPIIEGAYANAGNVQHFGPFNTVGFTHLAIAWQPSEDSFMNVTHLDQAGNNTSPNMVKQVTCKLGSTARLQIPIVTGQVKIDIFTIGGGAPCQGNLTAALTNGSDRGDAIQGVQALSTETGVGVVAGGTLTVFPAVITEGPAHLSMAGQPVGVIADLYTLNTVGTFDFLAELNPQGSNAPATIQLWIPARQLRIIYSNTLAAGISLYAALVVGG